MNFDSLALASYIPKQIREIIGRCKGPSMEGSILRSSKIEKKIEQHQFNGRDLPLGAD